MPLTTVRGQELSRQICTLDVELDELDEMIDWDGGVKALSNEDLYAAMQLKRELTQKRNDLVDHLTSENIRYFMGRA